MGAGAQDGNEGGQHWGAAGSTVPEVTICKHTPLAAWLAVSHPTC
jgi:hypothetical protein